jgi:hypothetical protein
MKYIAVLLFVVMTAMGQDRARERISPVDALTLPASTPTPKPTPEDVTSSGYRTASTDEINRKEEQRQRRRLASLAPVCKRCIFEQYDKVTGETSSYGRPITISLDNRSGFVIGTTRTADGIIAVNFRLAGGGACIDRDPQIFFLFRDGTRSTTRAQNDFNCDQRVSLYFLGVFGLEDFLYTLQTKPIETIRINTFKASVQEDFSPPQSLELMNQLRCLDKTP